VTDATEVARKLHRLIEPLHSYHYFAREVREAYTGLGLDAASQAYVAGRAAPLGPVGPKLAVAAFYNFHPRVMHEALPAAWEIASPATVLDARADAVEAMFAALEAPTDGVAEATELARAAAEATEFAGRPLAAANADVAPPGTPFADLWQALTVLREHRGDGHIALLTAAGLGPTEALVLHQAWLPALDRGMLQGTRRWGDDDWDAAVQRLRDRGWLDDDGAPTDEGAARRRRLEDETHALAAPPYEALGATASRRLFDLLLPLFDALEASGAFPFPLRRPTPFDT
jgi:hypothetical protein